MFKHISGDFAQEYNKILEELAQEQKSLDEKYSKRISQIVEIEKNRMEQNVPRPYEPGDSVKSIYKPITHGTVVSCPIEFKVDKNLWNEKQWFGPNRYLPLKNIDDETIITCDGDLRKIMVSIEPDPISKDWGVDKKVIEMWTDELEIDD